jgi:hypothetical protein
MGLVRGCTRLLATFWSGANGNAPIRLLRTILSPAGILLLPCFGNLAASEGQTLGHGLREVRGPYPEVEFWEGACNPPEFRRFLDLRVKRSVSAKMRVLCDAPFSFRTVPARRLSLLVFRIVVNVCSTASQKVSFPADTMTGSGDSHFLDNFF